MSKKEHIIQVTRDLILEQGLQSASMSKIGKASGVAIGSIYNLFPSKENLINEVYQYCRNQFLVYNFDRYNKPNMSFKEAIELMIADYIDNALVNKSDFLFVAQYQLSPVIKVDTRLDQGLSFGNITLSEAAETGVIKNLSPYLSSGIMVGIADKVIQSHLIGLIKLDEAQIVLLIKAIWDAIS